MFHLEYDPVGGSLAVLAGGKTVLRHSASSPAVYLGRGRESISVHRGNFDIEDYVDERIALRLDSFEDGRLFFSHPDLSDRLVITVSEEGAILRLKTSCGDPRFNRLWLRFQAEPDEHVTGGGEQFSCLDLRGRLFPIWARSKGTGRNPLSEVARLAEWSGTGGGSYHTTPFPQPSFFSSRLYFVHLESFEYSELDFRSESFHQLAVWSTEISLVMGCGGSYYELCTLLTSVLGRQPALPDWILKGLILGLESGAEKALEGLSKCSEGGLEVSAIRLTGSQADFETSEKEYPSVRKLDTIGPYLPVNTALFSRASSKGYLIKNADGADFIFEFRASDMGAVDLTKPEAFEWYRSVIKDRLLHSGLHGWFAEGAEYLPVDCVLSGGSGLEVHNLYPVLWTQCCREAIREADTQKECVFLSSSGGAGSQGCSMLMYSGEQFVDWSEDDGLPSAITAALSLGVSGFGLMSFDIGCCTSLFGRTRSMELMKRSLELACFTPVMLSNPGNRPEANLQLYSNDELITFAAKLVSLHNRLYPYLRRCVDINSSLGIPVMRPLFFEAPGIARSYDRELFSYMLGEDMIVCPVVKSGTAERALWLPEGDWIHLWTGRHYGGGEHRVFAPIGRPPVFYRAGSEYTELFESFR